MHNSNVNSLTRRQAAVDRRCRAPGRKVSVAPLALTLIRLRRVEVMGFEPTASSMRPKRSSQLSYTPEGRPAYLATAQRSERLAGRPAALAGPQAG